MVLTDFGDRIILKKDISLLKNGLQDMNRGGKVAKIDEATFSPPEQSLIQSSRVSPYSSHAPDPTAWVENYSENANSAPAA